MLSRGLRRTKYDKLNQLVFIKEDNSTAKQVEALKEFYFRDRNELPKERVAKIVFFIVIKRCIYKR